jgi:hypothetical protein
VFPDGREVRGGGNGEIITVHGSPAEVLLWLAGRHEAVAVSVEPTGDGHSMPIRLTV